jgi:hypothetical protein
MTSFAAPTTSRIESTTVPFHADGAMRGAGVLGLLGIGLIHFIDFWGKWDETKYVAVLYLALIAGTLLASALLLGGRSKDGWRLALLLSVATIIGYSVSRTWGLPASDDDIGNWLEDLGVASLFVEGVVVLLSAWALSGRSLE